MVDVRSTDEEKAERRSPNSIPLGILQARMDTNDGRGDPVFIIVDSTDPGQVVATYPADQVGSFLATLTMASHGFPRKQKWYDGFCRGFVRNGTTAEFRSAV